MAVARPLVPSRLAGLRPGHGETRRKARTRLGGYVALTKPRIIELLLVTTLPTMVLAQQGWPSLGLVVATLVGGTLAAGGANAMNMYLDRDIDRLMPRTQGRPIVTGAVSPGGALRFAIALEIVAVAELWLLVNALAAVLALSATVFYVVVYTLWLKRTSTRNIVIGGAAGAVPVLVGWAAVTGTLDWAPLVLFGVVFFWTPPHFWALAIHYADDYRAASVPMLPAVAPMAVTSRRMLGYTLVMWGLSLVLVPVAGTGVLYAACAAVLGAIFAAGCLRLRRRPSTKAAIGLFSYSITYLTLLFAALTVDTFVHG
jgi:protoheme IX farnesyltransferase